jgi:hypothetical protein
MASMYVGPFRALVRALIRERGVAPDQAEAAARAFVVECGCYTIEITDAATGAVVEMICSDHRIPGAMPPYRAKKRRR